MTEIVIEGEDVPIQVSYLDSGGNPVAPDGAGTSGPTLTITAPNDTEIVSATVMSELQTGTYEYVHDTAADGTGNGYYHMSVTADFSGETKIVTGNFQVV